MKQIKKIAQARDQALLDKERAARHDAPAA
jgi:hypothetical protein